MNVIQLLANIALLLQSPEVVEMVLPLYIKEFGRVLRLELFDIIVHMAGLGFERIRS